MIKICLTVLSNVRQTYARAFLLVTVLFSSIAFVQAQPDFSIEELRLMKERHSYSNAFKYRLPQEKFPMPEISNQSRSMMIDGDLDPTYNAFVAEGFGYVNKTVAQPDGKIVAVGLFQRANGVRAYGVARFNADGTLDTSFNAGAGANAAVRAVVLQPDGKIIIGGAFTAFNGQTVNRIVRLNSNGSVDSSFNVSTTLNGQVNEILLLPTGKIMVGGAFDVSSTTLIRLNGNGTLDSPISGIDGEIHSMALAPDGKIVVGGYVIARLNSDGTFDSTFTPVGANDGPVLKTIVQPNGKILAAGVFTGFNGVSTDGLIRLNNDGSTDATFEITNNPQLQFFGVYGLALQPDGKILASFFDDAYTPFGDVRRFNADASTDLTFNTNTNNSLTAVDINLLADGKVLAAGYFISVNNEQKLRLLKLNSDGSVDNAFNPALSTVGSVYTIKRLPDGKVFIGGDFEYVNGVRKSAIAKLNADGTLDNTFTIGAGFLGDIYAIETQSDGKVVIAGVFGGDTSFPAFCAARLNSNGSLDVSLGDFGDKSVLSGYALGIQTDGKILIGGQTIDLSSFTRLSALRVNPNATLDESFTPAILSNGTVRSLLIQPSGKIIIGGTFIFSPSFPRVGIARLNANGSPDSAVFGGNSNVYSIVRQSDGAIVAGGRTLTRHNSEGVFDSTLNTGTGFNNLIRAVEIQPDGKIILGGFFTTYKSSPVNRLIRVSSVGDLDTTFTPNPAGTVYALNLQTDGKILVGGQFLDFNNTEKSSIARLQNAAAPRRSPFDFDGDGKTDVSIFRPSSGEWWYQRSSDNQIPAVQFGSGTDKIVPGDYTGDGKTDVAFWRPSTGQWFILRSEDFSFYAFPFGSTGDIPAPADYDGDGKTDVAVFRPSNGVWYISKSTGGVTIQQFGLNDDKPVPADYDGDGKADIGIFRSSNGQWWIDRSNLGLVSVTFGDGNEKPVSGDYTGDGKADIAFFRPATGQWFVLRSEDLSFYSAPFGSAGDTPVPGDYDGDGRFDFAVFRSSNANWYVNRSTSGVLIQQFGFSTDQPVPSAFVP